MASAKQIDSNRRNAELSTGPKTLPGKRVSSMNALKFGFWSKQTVLWDEDPDVFDDFLQHIHADLKPVGSVEMSLSDLIAAKLWRLGRIVKVEKGLIEMYRRYEGIDGNPAVSFVHDASQLGCFERLSRCETSLERGVFRAIAELKRLQFLREAQSPVETSMVRVNTTKDWPSTVADQSGPLQELTSPPLGQGKGMRLMVQLSRDLFSRFFKNARKSSTQSDAGQTTKTISAAP